MKTLKKRRSRVPSAPNRNERSPCLSMRIMEMKKKKGQANFQVRKVVMTRFEACKKRSH